MTITTIISSTYLGDSIIYLRDDLLTNITDPISSTRPSDSKFVVSSYPKRAVTYPIITIVDRGITDIRPAGMRSEVKLVNITIEIRVWARNVVERDELTQAITDRLRQNQYGTGSTTEVGLYDYTLGSVVNVDEPGEAGIRSKVIHVVYMVVLGG